MICGTIITENSFEIYQSFRKISLLFIIYIWVQLLLVDKKITNPKEMFKILDRAVKEKYPIVIVAEAIEPEALAPVIRNKLRGVLRAAAIKAPSFGERKSHCLEDIAIMTGGNMNYFGLFCLFKIFNLSVKNPVSSRHCDQRGYGIDS